MSHPPKRSDIAILLDRSGSAAPKRDKEPA
jgi:hypothetical protein